MHPASYARETGPDGGMADAAASKAVVREGVRVQVPLRAQLLEKLSELFKLERPSSGHRLSQLSAKHGAPKRDALSCPFTTGCLWSQANAPALEDIVRE